MERRQRARIMPIIIGTLIAYGGCRTIGVGLMGLYFLVKWWSYPW
jgi:hypothetical protein